ncbi:MAG: FkbM family methyltransferase [Bryobacteraceae bacterium]|jgi:FkbM family methyltransferase
MGLKQTIQAVVPKPLWTKLRMLRMRYTSASYRPHRVVHNYGGYSLELELIDPMGAGWYDHDWAELPEIALLKQYGALRPGARVFDIGAHQCVVAMMLAKTVGPSGFVLAVEANPENRAAGERNRELNAIENCKILHAAGAAEPGTLIFNRGPNGQVDDGSGEWGQLEVKAVSVDQLASLHGFPDVLFIDVEGFECEVLKGARATLERNPDCFIEVHVGVGLEKFGGSVSTLMRFFPPGYQFFAAPPDNSFVPLREDSALLGQRFFLVAVAPRPTRSLDTAETSSTRLGTAGTR